MKINAEKDVIEELAKEMLVAARTAPKSKGLDTIITVFVEKKDYKKILEEMKKLFRETKMPLFERDAQNLKDSDACILIGVKNNALGLNCGACGYDCAGLEKARRGNTHYNGPNCAFKMMDLGIALGAAAAKAKDLCLDNRIMYSLGLAAKRAKLVNADILVAIPLSVKGKNIYFDRKWKR